MSFYVYMLASKRNGTLYTGSTDDLSRRMIEHKEHTLPGFAAKYDVGDLVWFEEHETRDSALHPRATDEEMAARLEDRTD